MNIFTKLLVLPALATTLLAATAEAARVYDCAGGGELEFHETIRLPLTYQQRRDLDRERSAHTKARSEIERILRAIPILERRARQARQQYNHPAYSKYVQKLQYAQELGRKAEAVRRSSEARIRQLSDARNRSAVYAVFLGDANDMRGRSLSLAQQLQRSGRFAGKTVYIWRERGAMQMTTWKPSSPKAERERIARTTGRGGGGHNSGSTGRTGGTTTAHLPPPVHYNDLYIRGGGSSGSNGGGIFGLGN